MREPGIGTLNEKSLHAALKSWYARPGDVLEQPVDGFVIDIVRGDLLIEIQTGNFTAIRRKLAMLTREHRLRLVYPLAAQKWLLKIPPEEGSRTTRRKSPRRLGLEALFDELIHIPKLMADPNFSLEVLLIHEEEVQRFVGAQRWRRRSWVTVERRLLQVVDQQLYETPADLLALLPTNLPATFTTADLADAMRRPRRLAQQMAYCLRELDLICVVGKRDRSLLYSLS